MGKKDIELESTHNGEFLLYQTEDRQTRVEVRMVDETVWLSQKLMADLFQKDVRTINEHIQNLFTEGELTRESTIREFRIVQTEGKREVSRLVDFYNLDVIISVGYRVRSHRGTQFRIWATKRLKEYIIKGFVLDDQRLKEAGGGNYFDELLERIRDIRSSEKVFWKKILDIYATSIDYDAEAQITRDFFAQIQNKIHWAAHGRTAAEIIFDRADSQKPHMGLTTWAGNRPRVGDSAIAKNYLREEEIDVLNRIVTMYLEFAELQALERIPMYMNDWIERLDGFLKASGRDILSHPGNVSHEQALEKARAEYEKYKMLIINDPTPVEGHFLKAEKEVKLLGEKNTGK